MKKILFFTTTTILIFCFYAKGQNPRLNLLEDQTFTSCGCCPCLDSIVRKCIIPAVPNTIFVRYHFLFSRFYSKNCDSLMAGIVANGRKLSVNRNGMFFDEPEFARDLHQLCDSVVEVIKKDTVAPVKLIVQSKTYQPSTRKLDVAVDFQPYQGDLSGTYMVNMVVTENRLLAEQTFHDSCGKPTEGKYDIFHQNVVRQMAYYLYSDKLTEGAWPISKTISRTFSITLDTAFIAENCNYTVYIYKKEDSICHSKIAQAFQGPITWPLEVGEGRESFNILKIVPNPAIEQINAHIRFGRSGVAEFSIIDQQGRVMEKLPPASIENQAYNYVADVSRYAPGIYFVVVKSGDTVKTEKFVVLKK